MLNKLNYIENPIPFGCGLRVVSNFWKKEDKSGEKQASLAQGAPNLLGAPCVSSANSKLISRVSRRLLFPSQQFFVCDATILKALANEDTLLLMMFLGCANAWETK